MPQDETMSQEQAFAYNKPEDTFQFDEQAEVATPAPQAETAKEEVAAPSAAPAVVEEQRVPYSRFKKVVEERDTFESRIAALEENLNKPKPAAETTNDMPAEWVELYGDSDAAKRAWSLQQKREEQIRKDAIKESIDYWKSEQQKEKERETANETALDEYLSSLSTVRGKKLSKTEEEALLTIVDEFSPVGADGTYSSMISPEKAIEIYDLRQASKKAPVQKARNAVATLTGDKSSSEPDTSEQTYKRGWDNWREAINN